MKRIMNPSEKGIEMRTAGELLVCYSAAHSTLKLTFVLFSRFAQVSEKLFLQMLGFVHFHVLQRLL